jgi:hypothetical protein
MEQEHGIQTSRYHFISGICSKELTSMYKGKEASAIFCNYFISWTRSLSATPRFFYYFNQFSPTKTKPIMLELSIMNNIAYFLASRSTDAVAVTLRKNLPLTFVLAKNRGMPDEKDITNARTFFSSMRDASTWKDVMPSIMSYGADRINAALAALASFQFEGLVSGERHYVFGALNEEFKEPAAERLAEFFNTREPLDILERLFYRVRERASFEVDPNCTKDPDELNAQLDKFTALKATAECLLNSNIPQRKVDMEVDWALEYKSRVERVTSYVHGIGQLIDRRRRCIKAGSDIPYVWLEYSDRETSMLICNRPILLGPQSRISRTAAIVRVRLK